ncbi:MAG: hypothetical protein JKY65_00665 [Planctomycetes bacterium]|nr:hypothetical protein [Planctomycetota bacterium]
MTRALFVAVLALLIASPAFAQAKKLPHAWPPVVGKEYPKLELKNSLGKTVKLIDFKGKVILIKPIGMGCPGCNAFAGAEKKGAYPGASFQKGIPSTTKIFKDYGKVKLSSKKIVVIHLLLYDTSNRKAPTVADAKKWAKHWGIDKLKNEFVLVGDARYINRASYNLIPGFQLIDKNFVLRSDSSGHRPKDNLYTKLAPMVKVLLKERAKRRR